MQIQMHGIVRQFPGVLALDEVDLEIHSGEILGLLGENGAGKTTLMNILYGLLQPNRGQILIDGRPVFHLSPRDAIRSGIGMVHQQTISVLNMTVAENLALALPGHSLILELASIRTAVRQLGQKHGLAIDPDAQVGQLPVGLRQRLEILKALCLKETRLLILDEPTACLTPQESEGLFRSLASMTKEGLAVVLITHRLDEAIKATDRIAILRQGRIIASLDTHEATQEALAKMMIGRPVIFQVEKPPINPGKTVVEVTGLTVRGDNGNSALQEVSFSIREGEILGIAGVAGNGQKELAETLAGLRLPVSGRVLLNNEEITRLSALKRADRGIRFVAESTSQSLCLGLPLQANFSLRGWNTRPSPFFLPTPAGTIKEAIDRFGISIPSLDCCPSELSGGNQQRLVLARELGRTTPCFLIVANPTQGLDVGSAEMIRQLLVDLRSQGVAIILISADLTEILSLSDRIAVLSRGQITGTTQPDQTNETSLGLLMGSANFPGED